MTDLERDILALFSPPTRLWFERTFGQPTPPQAGGWPAIQRGDHALILAPTGSGKTLAAFLWGIDQIYRELSDPGAAGSASGQPWLLSAPAGRRAATGAALRSTRSAPRLHLAAEGAQQRHPSQPARPAGRHPRDGRGAGAALPGYPHGGAVGRHAVARASGHAAPAPHILITTPESLYLLLTSPRAREMFRSVRTVIVDEIHTLVGTKRGRAPGAQPGAAGRSWPRGPVQRIGLSATMRPLDEAARFLGGGEVRVDMPSPRTSGYRRPAGDAGGRPLPQAAGLAGHHAGAPTSAFCRAAPSGRRSSPRCCDLIRQHRTTLVFCNNRRLAERTADRLNEQIAAEARGASLQPHQRRRGQRLGRSPRDRVEHGARPRPSRQRVPRGPPGDGARPEGGQAAGSGRDFFAGVGHRHRRRGPGGADPVAHGVAQGLQRVGRSGHLVGQTSRRAACSPPTAKK